MTKSIKKVTAVFLTAIMVFGTIGITAFATGTLTQTYGMSNNTPYYLCNYSVDGNNTSLTGHGKGGGAMENKSFYVTNSGSYTVEFSGSTGCSVTVNFWKTGTYPTGSAYKTIKIPQAASGMPAMLSVYTDFEKGYYDVEIIADKTNIIASGSLKVYGVLQNEQG